MKNQIRVMLMVVVITIGIVSSLFALPDWSEPAPGPSVDVQAIPYLQSGK